MMIKSFYIKNLFLEDDILIDFTGNKNDESRYMIGPNGNGKTTVLNLLFQTIVMQNEVITNTAYKFKYTAVNLEQNEIGLNKIYLYKINNDSCVYMYEFKSKILLVFVYDTQNEKNQIKIYEQEKINIYQKIEELIDIIESFMKKNNIFELFHSPVNFDGDILNNDTYHKYNLEAALILEKHFLNLTDAFEDENIFGYSNSIDIDRLKKTFCLNKLENSILYFPTYRHIGDIINNFQQKNRHGGFPFDDELNFVKDRKVIDINQENLDLIFNNFKNYLDNINSTGITKLMKEFIEKSLTPNSQNYELDLTKKDIEKVRNLVKKLNINSMMNLNFDVALSIEDSVNKNTLMNLATLNDLYTSFLKELNIKTRPVKILKSSLSAFFGEKIQLEFDETDFKINLSKNLNELSSGQKQLIGIVAFSLLEMNNSIFKKPLILIDEPELSLHIDWQRMLNHYLSAFKNNQYFVATHSPFFLRETDTSLILKVENDEN